MTTTNRHVAARIFHVQSALNAFLNRGLPEHVTVNLQVRWPLVLIPIVFLNQLLAPHVVWVALLLALIGFYWLGYLWVRVQAPAVSLLRERRGAILVAGDKLEEDFELRNESRLPVLWAEFVDGSNLPNYSPGRVVACSAENFYRWRSEVLCRQRGVFRLGPYSLLLGDPFGLFRIHIQYDVTDVVLIYPRVVQVPELPLPHGNASGADRRRRYMQGPLPATSVTDYRPGDSLRRIHWPTTAHRGRLMVKELELEPSGDVWIVVDLDEQVHSGEGPESTLEYSIIMAASLAAELLSGGERRGVGLLAVSRDETGKWGNIVLGNGQPEPPNRDVLSRLVDESRVESSDGAVTGTDETSRTLLLAPQPGQAQLWRIMAALAPVQASNVSLSTLLHSSREALGRRRTLVVITPRIASTADLGSVTQVGQANGNQQVEADFSDGGAVASSPRMDWLAELLHLQSAGLESSVLLIAPAERTPPLTERLAEPSGDGAKGKAVPPAMVLEPGVDVDVASSGVAMAEQMRAVLSRYDIPARVVVAGSPLHSVLTFRRKRTVVRTTPTGGVVTYEVEEEVG